LNARSAARIAWTAAAVSAALGIGGLFFDWLGGLGMSSPVSSAYPMVWALSISLIGALVEQTLLTVIVGRTTREQAKQAQEQLQRAHTKLAGFILLNP